MSEQGFSRLYHQMIRVLHLIPSGGIGGIETFAYELARTVDRRQIALTVCSLAGEGPMLDRIRETGVEAFSVDLGMESRFSSFARYLSHLRRGRFDIVHANAGGRKLRRLAKMFGCLIVSHCHSYPFEWGGSAPAVPDALQDYGTPGDWLIFCCAWLQGICRKHGCLLVGKSSVIHSGVDTDRFHGAQRALRVEAGIAPDAPVVGFVGRFADQKGLPYLFASAHSLLAACPDACFVLIGDGPLRPYVETEIRRIGSDRFKLPGARLDVERWLPLIDVVMLPSKWEASSMVALEAMAAERAVVAFAVGGIPEIVVPGETGILVPHGDVAGLTANVLALLQDPARRHRIGVAARRHVEHYFSVGASTKKITSLYEHLTGGRQ